MIKVSKFVCLNTVRIGKTVYTGGHIYFGRASFSGRHYMMLTDNNTWVDITNPLHGMGFDGRYQQLQFIGFENYFEKTETVFIKNKAELRKLTNNMST